MTTYKTVKERHTEIFLQDFRDVCHALHSAKTFAAIEDSLLFAVLMCQKIGATISSVSYVDGHVKLHYKGVVMPRVRVHCETLWEAFTTMLSSSQMAICSCIIDVSYSKLGVPAKPRIYKIGTDTSWRKSSVSYDYEYYALQHTIAETIPHLVDLNKKLHW
ncbi:MAG: hypothetical protein K2F91_08320 [Muribaculaceae bacterium]|nr:hypothetical protein [Muribaculaceae bacterium]